MDQLADIGVEFDADSLRRLLAETEKFYRDQPMATALPTKEAPPAKGKPPKAIKKIKEKIPDSLKDKASKIVPVPTYKWAIDDILVNNHPVRPWATGAILRAHSPAYTLAGTITRSPGKYHKLNRYDGKVLPEFLEDTNEQVHPSVRIRLAVGGLGYDDKRQWNASALTDAGWDLVKRADGKWCWVYNGTENLPNKVMRESIMGYFEKKMLELAGGRPNVLEYVDNMRVEDIQARLRGNRKPSEVKKGDNTAVPVRNTV